MTRMTNGALSSPTCVSNAAICALCRRTVDARTSRASRVALHQGVHLCFKHASSAGGDAHNKTCFRPFWGPGGLEAQGQQQQCATQGHIRLAGGTAGACLCMQARCVFSWSARLPSSCTSRASICPSLSTCRVSAAAQGTHRCICYCTCTICQLLGFLATHALQAWAVTRTAGSAGRQGAVRTWDCMSMRCCCSRLTSVASSSVTCCRMCCRSPATPKAGDIAHCWTGQRAIQLLPQLPGYMHACRVISQ